MNSNEHVRSLLVSRFGAKTVGAWCMFLLVGYALFVSWLDPALPWPVSFSNKQPWALVCLNLVPVLILHAALLVVTRRLLMSSWLTVLALTALYVVNHIKLQELATPLLPDDFQFLRTIGVSYTFFSQYLASFRLQLLLVIVVVVITLLMYRERPVSALAGPKRWGFAVFALLLWSSLVQGSAPWKTLYDPGRLQFEPWAPKDSAARTGLITNMLLLHWELAGIEYEPLDLDSFGRILREQAFEIDKAAAERADSAYPDIIVVQSESLFDVGRLVEFDVDAMPRLNAARSRGWSGDLYVPTFAGGTIRTEFEVLTSLPLHAFPQVRYPYLQLTRREIPSLMRELRTHGYRTLAIHPNGGAFWNRNQAFRSLGFDRFMDGDLFVDAARYGWYVSDAALVDRIIAEMPDDGAPAMVMAISIQNHGPYDHVPLPSNDRVVLHHSRLDESARTTLESYLALVRATDDALGRLIDFVDARSRDTLLLIYSDHLPPLHAVYSQLGFRDHRRPEEQPVPWLLIDNRSREARVQSAPAWWLATTLLKKAELPTSTYYSIMGNVAQTDVRDNSAAEAIKALARLQYEGVVELALSDQGS